MITYRPTDPGPATLLAVGRDAPADEPTHTRWQDAPGIAAAVAELADTRIGFATSGSTGAPRVWQRTVSSLWDEAGALIDLLGDEPIDGVVAFAPPKHLFGALGSVFVAARLGVPVWYRSGFAGGLPEEVGDRPLVVAIPWVFGMLERYSRWWVPTDTAGGRSVRVLYSSAALPRAAHRLSTAHPAPALRIVEILGSTETGGIASRRLESGVAADFRLFDDVRYPPPVTDRGPRTEAAGDPGTELIICSPRLAERADAPATEVPAADQQVTDAAVPATPPPGVWTTGDLVEVTGTRTFTLIGRISRLAKINGRRIDLDAAEAALRDRLGVTDLHLVRVDDADRGEHVELFLVPMRALGEGEPVLDAAGLTALRDVLGGLPRAVHPVERLVRSALGKPTNPGPPLAPVHSPVPSTQVGSTR